MADRSRRRKGNNLQRSGNTNVTVLFCEKNLQQTFSFDPSTTIAKVKEIGSEQLLDHLRLNTVSPSDLSIDHSCTDFYPVPLNDSIQIGDLAPGNAAATMIVWPKPLPGLADLTPSPFLDKLARQDVELKRMKDELEQKTADLDEARSKLRMFEERERESTCQEAKRRGGPAQGITESLTTPSSCAAGEDESTIDMILRRLAVLEVSSIELQSVAGKGTRALVL